MKKFVWCGRQRDRERARKKEEKEFFRSPQPQISIRINTKKTVAFPHFWRGIRKPLKNML
jgi:hypothetical protein